MSYYHLNLFYVFLIKIFVLKKKIFSDEAHFHLGESVNKQIYPIWSSENPDVILQKSMHPIQVTVGGGLWSEGVIGSYFFENKNVATTRLSF